MNFGPTFRVILEFSWQHNYCIVHFRFHFFQKCKPVVIGGIKNNCSLAGHSINYEKRLLCLHVET